MDDPMYDVAILGAGPVGQALALLLAQCAQEPARIALLTTHTALPGKPAATMDPRVLALNHGSRVLLETLHAWPTQSADIRHIHVSQRGRLGSTVIDHQDFKVPQLGSVVPYTGLHGCLTEQIAASGITVLSGAPAQIDREHADHVVVSQGPHTLRCRIAVLCDGAANNDLRRDYGQHAVITSAHAELPRQGWAWERFTREGPLAMLPHPQTPNAYSVVWCCSPAHATALTQLDDAQFSTALSQAFGERLGRLSSQAPRHVFPLVLKARRSLARGRTATIGNAAQTLHPVAGQGLNLGLRDAMQLAQTLQQWLQQPQTDPRARLMAFTRDRQMDRWLTASLTDLMPRIFATGQPLVEHACGLALMTLDMAAPLRAPLARHLLQGLRI